MGNADGLTIAQRARRRIALLGGSYTHPDGSIELDFEEPAGIDFRSDSEELQGLKLAAHEHRNARGYERAKFFVSGLLVGAAITHWWPSLWPF